VIEQACGDLIARMDADDISHSDRISRELEVLERNPNAGLVGSLFAIIDSRGNCRTKADDFGRDADEIG